jgi:hypothetical protein
MLDSKDKITFLAVASLSHDGRRCLYISEPSNKCCIIDFISLEPQMRIVLEFLMIEK